MVTTDPIADMLTRIRNAIAIDEPVVNVPHSNLKMRLAEVLKAQGFIENVEATEVAGFKRLIITLYQPGHSAKISRVRRLSSPGRRLYKGASDLPRSMSGRGVVIVSTSKGIMTDTEARRQKVGGELICEVY